MPAMITLPSLVVALLPLTQDPAAQPATPAAEAPRLEGHFAWPVPGRVRVVEKITKGGHEAELGYVLVLGPAPDGRGILVRHVEDRFLSLDGKKPEEVGDMAGYQQAMNFMQAAPDLRIGADGKVLEVLEIDRAIKATLATLAKRMTQEEREAHLPKLEARFAQQDMRDAIGAATRAHWDNWVGNWVGLALPPAGKKLETEVETPLLTGEKTPAKVSVANLGPAKGHTGHVELSSTSLVEGGKFLDTVVEMTRKMMPEPMRAQVSKDMFEKAALEQRLRSIIELGSLRPALVVHERIVTVQPRGREAQRQVERREFRFDWSTAEDGGVPAEASGK